MMKRFWVELLGLFVDDGALALQCVILIAVVAGAVKLMSLSATAAGFGLLIGCLIVLGLSLLRQTRRR